MARNWWQGTGDYTTTQIIISLGIQVSFSTRYYWPPDQKLELQSWIGDELQNPAGIHWMQKPTWLKSCQQHRREEHFQWWREHHWDNGSIGNLWQAAAWISIMRVACPERGHTCYSADNRRLFIFKVAAPLLDLHQPEGRQENVISGVWPHIADIR